MFDVDAVAGPAPSASSDHCAVVRVSAGHHIPTCRHVTGAGDLRQHLSISGGLATPGRTQAPANALSERIGAAPFPRGTSGSTAHAPQQSNRHRVRHARAGRHQPMRVTSQMAPSTISATRQSRARVARVHDARLLRVARDIAAFPIWNRVRLLRQYRPARFPRLERRLRLLAIRPVSRGSLQPGPSNTCHARGQACHSRWRPYAAVDTQAQTESRPAPGLSPDAGPAENDLLPLPRCTAMAMSSKTPTALLEVEPADRPHGQVPLTNEARVMPAHSRHAGTFHRTNADDLDSAH